MKMCPRCKTEREDYLFQEPVTLCMLCYSTIQGNEDLSPQGLIAKAKKQRKGRLLRNAQKRMGLAQAFQELGKMAKNDKQKEDTMRWLEENEQPSIECEKCGKETLHYNSTMTTNGVKLYCTDCLKDVEKVHKVTSVAELMSRRGND